MIKNSRDEVYKDLLRIEEQMAKLKEIGDGLMKIATEVWVYAESARKEIKWCDETEDKLYGHYSE